MKELIEDPQIIVITTEEPSEFSFNGNMTIE